jgi:antitoxin YefM
MTVETNYTQARENLASYFDRATDDRDVIIVRRRNGRDVAIIAADELESLMETAHLLSSPRNAQRLLSAINRALANEGEPLSLESLKREVGLSEPSS